MEPPCFHVSPLLRVIFRNSSIGEELDEGCVDPSEAPTTRELPLAVITHASGQLGVVGVVERAQAQLE